MNFSAFFLCIFVVISLTLAAPQLQPTDGNIVGDLSAWVNKKKLFDKNLTNFH